MKFIFTKLVFTTLLLIFGISLMANAKTLDQEERCDQSTVDEIECYQRVAERADFQLRKDLKYLTQLATSRNRASIRHLNMGHLSFRNYVQKNCESESHDALGATLEEVIEKKCRRDTILARRRLFERIGESHPLGKTAERVFGRPICNSFLDQSKPTVLGANVKLGDVDLLRKRLDQKGADAAAEGYYHPSIATLPRAVHKQAEELRTTDATHTCLGILMAFCPHVSSLPADETGLLAKEAWLSRCQTEIRGAYYKRATQRLRQLEENSPAN
ncbi:MAG: hypothetical protein J0L82_10695 [Deltaproteobacteria bacterium]|jgi:hypothetical protein|nr:hypothetical protein [Deltaproteobacteria bacterium]